MKNLLVRRSLIVLATSLSVVAVGCGATGGKAESVSAGLAPKTGSAAFLAGAAKTTSAVSSEKVQVTVETTPAGAGPSISITSTGEIDAANKKAHLTADLSGSMGGTSKQAAIETVYDGDTVYLKAPFLQVFGATKPWIKVTSPKIADAVSKLGGSVQPDPGTLLTFLEGAGGPVKELGTEDVRGTPTRHVSVELDVAKVLDQAGVKDRKKLEEHLTQHGVALGDLGPIPAQAWIDGDGYVRRFSVSYDLGKLASLHHDGKATGPSGQAPTITETIELYDFNQPVDITVPPKADVSELDLSKAFGH
ncbi:hypothetical protein [Aquihabitans sp. McL0605]|uniref:hypothetical protein n=1 Tax=Aquihabitans sp. McL0605 TaxID=3415671 RepID=UPI003CF43F14